MVLQASARINHPFGALVKWREGSPDFQKTVSGFDTSVTLQTWLALDSIGIFRCWLSWAVGVEHWWLLTQCAFGCSVLH